MKEAASLDLKGPIGCRRKLISTITSETDSKEFLKEEEKYSPGLPDKSK